ncbi:MAG TPA: aminodeoxychorismate/anthranilate synthase component II [Candidatus Dormibacteraeota bacterium]|nr:aminodeoxychorismate/anthranilate synthase component II [Candidatus Dormibacteraeota bacterium]
MSESLHGVVAVVDNYDSFTYNLVQYLGELGARVAVFRNDALSAAELAEMEPAGVVISPGPCTPDEAGISLDVVRLMGASTPLLGVCLGHQAIGQAYGGRVVRAPTVMHGKVSRVRHDGSGVFAGLPDPFEATRYHSLVVERSSLPQELQVTAWTDDGLVMGLRHRVHPVAGVQFHPESICTPVGHRLLGAFLAGIPSVSPSEPARSASA